VSPGLVGLAIAVVAGGIVAVAVRDGRVAVIGFALAAVLSPLLSAPLPGPLPLGARLVAAVLAGYLLWAALRTDLPARGSVVGWPAEALLAAACVVAAAGFAGLGAIDPAAGGGGIGEVPGPVAGHLHAGAPEALLAGFALGGLSVAPVAGARDALRFGMGVLLAIHAAILVRAGLAGAPSDAEQLATAGLVAVLGASVAAVAAAAIGSSGSLALVAGRRPAAHAVTAEPRRRFRLPVGPSAGRPPASPPAARGATPMSRPPSSEAAGAADASAAPDPSTAPPPSGRPEPVETDEAATGEAATDADGPRGGSAPPSPIPGIAPRSAGSRRLPGR
jgi:hypothetical protein